MADGSFRSADQSYDQSCDSGGSPRADGSYYSAELSGTDSPTAHGRDPPPGWLASCLALQYLAADDLDTASQLLADAGPCSAAAARCCVLHPSPDRSDPPRAARRC